MAGRRAPASDGLLTDLRSDVAFVFQQFSLYPHLSAYDNLAFFERTEGAGGEQLWRHTASGIAYAYYLAGDKAKAQAALKTVGGTDGSADFARLWMILAR